MEQSAQVGNLGPKFLLDLKSNNQVVWPTGIEPDLLFSILQEVCFLIPLWDDEDHPHRS